MSGDPDLARGPVFIVNPVAASGRALKRWRQAETGFRQLYPELETIITERPGHAALAARRAVREGRSLVVGVGGDGTVGEVVNGFFLGRDRIRSGTRLGLVPVGTGGDTRRTFGLPEDLAEILEIFARGRGRRIDLGRLTATVSDEGPGIRYFINVSSAGIGAEVVRRVNRFYKYLGGAVGFSAGAVATFATFRNRPVRVRLDGAPMELVAQQVVVANCRYYGGGMRVAPEAEPDDGWLDVVVVGDLTRRENLRLLGRVRSGDHRGAPKISFHRARLVEVDCSEHFGVEADGEPHGRAPARWEVVPGAVEMIVP